MVFLLLGIDDYFILFPLVGHLLALLFDRSFRVARAGCRETAKDLGMTRLDIGASWHLLPRGMRSTKGGGGGGGVGNSAEGEGVVLLGQLLHNMEI